MIGAETDQEWLRYIGWLGMGLGVLILLFSVKWNGLEWWKKSTNDNCDQTSSRGHGISVGDNAQLSVEDSEISENFGSGINIERNAKVKVRRVKVRNNGKQNQ